MAEDTIDKQIDEGTIEAFESVCSVLGHDVIGQFSIFDGAWQVIMMALADNNVNGDLTSADVAQLQATMSEVKPLIKAVMQTSENIRRFLFPQLWLVPGENSQTEREYNQERWAPYNRAAWNAFFAGVHMQIDQAMGQLDQIEAYIADLRAHKIEQALDIFEHFEPMLAANLRERLKTVVDRYTLKSEHSG